MSIRYPVPKQSKTRRHEPKDPLLGTPQTRSLSNSTKTTCDFVGTREIETEVRING